MIELFYVLDLCNSPTSIGIHLESSEDQTSEKYWSTGDAMGWHTVEWQCINMFAACVLFLTILVLFLSKFDIMVHIIGVRMDVDK